MFKEINFIIWRTPQEFEGGVNGAGQEKEGKMRSQNFHNHKYLKKRAKSETVEVETLPPTYSACCDSDYSTHLHACSIVIL